MAIVRIVSPVIAVSILAACGGTGGSTTTTSPPDTTTTSRPSPSETVFGYLHSFEQTEEGDVVVGIDEAEMLSGEEALAAAREDGVIGEDEDLPNDFYIRNPDGSITQYVVSPDAPVLLQASRETGLTQETVDLETWSLLVGGEEDPGLDWMWYGGGFLPYHFDVEGDEIHRVEEQYLP